ncbi:MAG: flagellar protein FlaG [Thermodesulfovibrionales bacterium]|nr:flagellar protein FlaG [Thermodesulfovibrionales bacterium]
MNNEHIRNTQYAKKGQDSMDEAVRINLSNQEVQIEEAKEVKKIEIKQNITKAFFAVTEDENVVIKIVDEEGNLIRQIPPEEYIKLLEFFKNYNKNLFSKEV